MKTPLAREGTSIWSASFHGQERGEGRSNVQRKGVPMDLNGFLNYYTLPSGNVLVYSQNEVVVITGTKAEVAGTLRYILQRLKTRGASTLNE